MGARPRSFVAVEMSPSSSLLSPSAYFMKHPPKQYTDDEAYTRTEDFIAAHRDV